MIYTILRHIALSIILFFLSTTVATAQTPPTIELFWANGCPHCEKAQEYLLSLQQQYPSLHIQTYEISSNSQHAQLLNQRGKELNADVSGVPFIVIGDQYISGF